MNRGRLRDAFEHGAGAASAALSSWLGLPAVLRTSGVDDVDLVEATELLGPADTLVASCAIDLSGRIAGRLLLVFEDRSGLALADLLLRQPAGTATAWGELEQSAANETANIVGCAYVNALADRLPPSSDERPDADAAILPSPPGFRREFAGSLLESALMDQAVVSDRLIVARTNLEAEGRALDWTLLLIPSGDALQRLSA